MIDRALTNLNIHKLTQEQYDRELAAGNIDENAIYLTPHQEQDLSGYATVEQVNGKADVGHNHDSAYDSKGAANSALSSAKSYTDAKVSGLATVDQLNDMIVVSDTKPSSSCLWFDTGSATN